VDNEKYTFRDRQKRINIILTEQREEAFDKLKRITGQRTTAKAIDKATKITLKLHEHKQELINGILPLQVVKDILGTELYEKWQI